MQSPSRPSNTPDRRRVDRCVLCSGSFLNHTQLPRHPISDNCGHLPEVCVRCLEGAINRFLDGAPTGHIVCPHPTCAVLLVPEEIFRAVGPSTAQRYVLGYVGVQNRCPWVAPGGPTCALTHKLYEFPERSNHFAINCLSGFPFCSLCDWAICVTIA
jgi:hypothetical protein